MTVVIRPWNKAHIEHIIKKTAELMINVFQNMDHVKEGSLQPIDVHDTPKVLSTNFEKILEQIDALVDMEYYLCDTACRGGIDLHFRTEDVKQFSCHSSVPEKATELTTERKYFLQRMILSELTELAETVEMTSAEVINMYQEALNHYSGPTSSDGDVKELFRLSKFFEEISIQSKFPFNEIFYEVHEANMRKRNPSTGKFEVRATDGKILKPTGWVGPNNEKILMEYLSKFNYKV